MRLILLRKSCTAALAAVFFSLLSSGAARAGDAPARPSGETDGSICPGALDARSVYESLAAGEGHGRALNVEVDPAGSPGFSVDALGGGFEARYRMAFNNIAEGWSWQPQADPRQEDYYRAKFLPLGSVWSERGAYDQQDKIGETQHVKVLWRTDYFLAFDNPYDFYARAADDDAGFAARLPAAMSAEALRMVAVARSVAPFVQESTTFWKATHGKPTDFTLKKRYLMAELEAILFCDRASGRLLGRVSR